jgi:hypothetical protein
MNASPAVEKSFAAFFCDEIEQDAAQGGTDGGYGGVERHARRALDR